MPAPNEPHSTPATRRIFRALSLVFKVFLGLLGLLVLFVLFLHTRPGQAVVRARVQSALSERMYGHAELGKLDFALFGSIEIDDLTLYDGAGRSVVTVRRVYVRPRWWQLLGGTTALDQVELEGLTLTLEEQKDGTLNVAHLFKPKPPEPKRAPSKPSKRHIVIGKLQVRDVDLTLSKQDGSRLAVSDFGLDGSVDALPGERTAKVTLTNVAGSLSRSTKDGPRIVLTELSTGLDLDVKEGVGVLQVDDTKARFVLERPKQKPFASEIGFSAVELKFGPGELDASLQKLSVGLVLLESLELDTAREGAALRGEQKATLVGLVVRADKVNALLDQPLLASDVRLRAGLSGPPERIVVSVNVTAEGLDLALAGHVNVSDLTRPRYQLTLTGKNIATAKLLAKERQAKVPPITVEQLTLALDGQGVTRDKIATDIDLKIDNTTVRSITVDRAALKGRFERGVLRIDELAIDGLDQKLRARGRFEVAPKQIDLRVSVSGDPSRALDKLRAAGLPIKTRLPRGGIVIADKDLELHVSGGLNDELAVDFDKSRVRVAGGSIVLDGNAKLRRGADQRLALSEYDVDARLNGVRIASLSRLARREPKLDGRVSGHIRAKGTRAHPDVRLDLQTDFEGPRRGAHLRAKVDGRVTPRNARLTVSALKVEPGGETKALAKVEAELPLSGGKLSPGGPLLLDLHVPKTRLSEIAKAAPDALAVALMKYPDAELSADAELRGTVAKPTGNFQVRVETEAVPGMDGGKQQLAVAGIVRPTEEGSRIETDVDVHLDHRKPAVVKAAAKIALDKSPLLRGAFENPSWSVRLDAEPPPLDQLPAPLARPGLGGKVQLHAELAGNRRDLGGKVALAARGVQRGAMGPLDADLEVSVADRVQTQLEVRSNNRPLVRLEGQVGLAKTDLITKLRARDVGDPTVSARLSVPRQRTARLAVVSPKLAKAPGTLGGAIDVSGTVKKPLARGELSLEGPPTLDGSPSRAAVSVNAGAERVGAQLGIGTPRAGRAPVRVSVSTPRPQLESFVRGEGQLDVELAARAERVELAGLVPRPDAAKDLDLSGRLDWNMDGKLSVVRDGEQRKLSQAELTGALNIPDLEVQIPSTARRYHSGKLRIESQPSNVSMLVHLEESDLQHADRQLNLQAKLAHDNLKPRHVDLKVRANQWLLFGSELLGKPDAPRAALTAAIDVDGSLGAEQREIVATVQSLKLSMPDRFDRAHWPEKTHLGDLVELDGSARPGVLPQPERPPVKPKPTAQAAAGPPTHIVLRIPKPIYVQKQPFEMNPRGELSVWLVPGKEPRIEGTLSVDKGFMTLGGREHHFDTRKQSRIIFDEKTPRGRVDFWLKLDPNPAMLRDVARASAGGDDVRMHLEGPIAGPVATVTGVANADLWDMLPVYNGGRVKHHSEPDLPASLTVDVPREYDVVLLSYMAVNLPHNLFLDRMDAWADAYDSPGSYGQVRHMEAERYSESGKTRVRVITRPPEIGRSEADLELDAVLLDQARTKAGVGAAAGSRAGGGPVLFFEWSSDD